ncbi:MAG: GNAT family N-acetyltransferase [Novosphingobium sp.]|nr:GNAT family N-acetyltransferase [Novosphingobium sp.]
MIESDRLILRGWEERDYAPFAAINADPEVMTHLDGPMDRAKSDAMIERIRAQHAEQGHCLWAVERKADGALLGFCGLRRGGHEGSPVDDVLEIGWRLARAAWGQGYAREAAQASLDWAWQNLDDARIVAWTVPANTRSWGLMLRLGMEHRPELDFEHPGFPPDHPLRQHVVYVIDRPG